MPQTVDILARGAQLFGLDQGGLHLFIGWLFHGWAPEFARKSYPVLPAKCSGTMTG
jgi:hypothetical protein